jgi:hypothetical protein
MEGDLTQTYERTRRHLKNKTVRLESALVRRTGGTSPLSKQHALVWETQAVKFYACQSSDGHS